MPVSKVSKKDVGAFLSVVSGIALLGLAYARNPVAGFLATLGLAGGLILLRDD